jgi:hypothetical protein
VKRLIIICEGETEQEFCKTVLSSHFLSKNIQLQYPKIKKSNGGIVKWTVLKKEIENHLKQSSDTYVTTLIDFYGIKIEHDFPCFYHNKKDNRGKVSLIEEGMKKDIDSLLSYRFIPYIQLHEFECFIFTSLDVLKNNFKPHEADFSNIEQVIKKYPNPEDINEGVTTAPSKRLEKFISVYNKPIYGALLTAAIGLPEIRKKCQRFNNWIEQLEKI